MCGIAGIFHFKDHPVGAEVLERMSLSLSHRGPDDEGTYFSRERSGHPTMGIAHRRLSIIDLELGHQPMANEDGTVWVVFNGEIYNYKALRQELESEGHRFATNSDTETIVHLYEEHGTACVEKLRGMFAIAVWDAPRRRLLLEVRSRRRAADVRDRPGRARARAAAAPARLAVPLWRPTSDVNEIRRKHNDWNYSTRWSISIHRKNRV